MGYEELTREGIPQRPDGDDEYWVACYGHLTESDGIMTEDRSDLKATLEEVCKGTKGVMFVFFVEGGTDYTYNDDGMEFTDEELKQFAMESAVQDARETAPWLFRLDDDKVTEVTRVR